MDSPLKGGGGWVASRPPDGNRYLGSWIEGIDYPYLLSIHLHVHIYLISTHRQEGRLKTEIGVSGGGHVTVLDTPTPVGDGAWHCLGLAVVGRHGAMVVDNVTVTATLHTTIRTGE